MINWKNKFAGLKRPSFKSSEKYQELIQKYFDAYSILGGDKRYENINKILFCEKTKKFPGSDKCNKYTFYFFDLVSYSRSRAIKEVDLFKFGITREMANDPMGIPIKLGNTYTLNGNIFEFPKDVHESFMEAIEKLGRLASEEFKKSLSEFDKDRMNKALMWNNLYNSYLISEEWREKRNLRIKEDNYCCDNCGAEENLQVHHRHYDSVGVEDVILDLVTLCRDCHKAVHNIK